MTTENINLNPGFERTYTRQRIMRSFSRAWMALALLLSDMVSLMLAILAAMQLRQIPDAVSDVAYLRIFIVLGITMAVLFYRKGLYPGVGMHYVEELRHIVSSCIVAFLVMIAMMFAFQNALYYSRLALGLMAPLCIVFIPFGRYLTRSLQFHIGNRPAGYVGAILVGFSFAVGWTPCVGPILGAILALASSTAHITSGLLLLGAYSVGLGIPFLLSAVAINSFFHFFSKFKRYIELVHIGGGLLLILVGTLIFTGYLTVLNSIAIQFTPAWLWERL